jgi:hypothetical protein
MFDIVAKAHSGESSGKKKASRQVQGRRSKKKAKKTAMTRRKERKNTILGEFSVHSLSLQMFF